jgi:NTP pyrophosphatase (non-canonical NTP hydrolase)
LAATADPNSTSNRNQRSSPKYKRRTSTFADLAEKFEAASQIYVEKTGIVRDPDWFILKLQEEMGELTQAWNRLSGRGRPKGRTPEQLEIDIADETADILGHILLFAHHNGIDLPAAIERKWLFRPES